MGAEAFHIRCKSGEIGKYVFLTGDPGRVPQIAGFLENSCMIAQNREFVTYTGTLDGIKMSVTSTGIGGPSAAIAIEELASLGAHTFIRIGTCGGMQPEIEPGTLILPTGVIRMEGTSREYLPLEFPAIPDFDLLSALVSSAHALRFSFHTGVVHCKDSFYGQHSPETMPTAQMLQYNWNAWKAAGAIASEMESAALFTIAAIRHLRCATVLQMIWNQERETVLRDSSQAQDDMTNAIETAVLAMRQWIRKSEDENHGTSVLRGR